MTVGQPASPAESGTQRARLHGMQLLTLRSILVATDLDDASVPALRTASHLADLSGAALHLQHVTEEPAHDARERLLTHYRDVASDAPDPAGIHIATGVPGTTIVETAAAVDADAIVLGRHRKGGTAGRVGSTAAHVVRTADCPCLVAATELRLPLERVLAPIDLSDIASGALSVALTWASALRPRGASVRLTALHVTHDSGSPAIRGELGAAVARNRDRAGGAAQVRIEESVVADTDTIQTILRLAAGSDLLVMGTRGSTDDSSSLGSVSAAVARTTPCPLLLVPPPVWEQRGEAKSRSRESARDHNTQP